MASNSGRKSGSSDRSKRRKRVVIGANETVRVRYRHDEPEVESERKSPRGKRKAGTARDGSPGKGARGKPGLSDAKREERERRQRLARLRQVALALALATAVAFAAWGAVALYRAPILPVKNIEVSGGFHYDRAALLSIAGIPADATLLRLPEGRIEASLTADPWIRSAKVERTFPGTVRISVEERRPAAVVDAGGANVMVVSADGYWLGKRGSSEEGLVVVSNLEEVVAKPGVKVREPEITNALAVIDGLSPELRAQTISVSAPSVDETAIMTKGDVEIFIGEATQMAEKDRIIQEILARQEGVVYINVRVVDRPTWRGLSGD
jgi:cell division protein FtsQ